MSTASSGGGGGGGGSGTLTMSGSYLYDTSTSNNVTSLDLGSGTFNANNITGGTITASSTVTLDSVGVTLATGSGAVVAFADGTTQSSAGITSGSLTATLNNYLPLAGGTMTNRLNCATVGASSSARFQIPHGQTPIVFSDGDMWTTTAGLFYRINGVTVSPATLAGGTYTGKITTLTSATTGAGLNLPHGAAPTTPVNGDIWTTTANLQVRINGATVSPALTSSTNTFSQKQTFNQPSLSTAAIQINGQTTTVASPSAGDILHTTGTINQLIGYTNSMRGAMTACRAFVNFDGSSSGNFPGGVSTVSRTSGSTTATITSASAHGLAVGNNINVLTGVAAGIYAVVSVPSTTTFTITTVATTVLTAASITFALNVIRSSFNVSSITDNGVGDYTINFTWPMVDDTYSCFFSVNSAGGTNATGYAAAVKAAGIVNTPDLKTTSAVRIIVASTSATADLNLVQASFFR